MKFDFEKEAFINSLREMTQDYGRMILNDEKKCYALWLDYAPQLTEEGDLLKVFLELGLGKQVTELKGCSHAERAAWQKLAIENMMRTGEQEKDVTCLVDAVLEALGWGIKQEPAAEVKSQATVVKPMETVKAPTESAQTVKPQAEPVKSAKESAKQESAKKAATQNTGTTSAMGQVNGRVIPPKPSQPKPEAKQYIRFGPEEKVEYLNKHLSQVQGFSVYIVPNNRANSKYTIYYARGFQLVSNDVAKLGINASDMILGIVTEETMIKGALKHALVFSDECIYQILNGYTWKIRYREIERTEIQDNRIVLWKRSGAREHVQPFHYEFNTRALQALIRALVEGESRRTEVILPNSQYIEPPKEMLTSPYYVKAYGMRPGDTILCRTSPKARTDNYMKECTYISQARKVMVLGKTGNMLYVEIGKDCHGWIFSNVVKKV